MHDFLPKSCFFFNLSDIQNCWTNRNSKFGGQGYVECVLISWFEQICKSRKQI